MVQRIISGIFAVMLIFSCAGSVLAQEQQQGEGHCGVKEWRKYFDGVLEEPGRLYVNVQDEKGLVYRLSTSANDPEPWFSRVKPYDVVRIVCDDAGHTYAILPHPDLPRSSSCWPFQCAHAQIESVVPAAAGGGVVAVYLVPGVGQVALLVTGAVVVGATTYHIATSDDPTCVKIKTEKRNSISISATQGRPLNFPTNTHGHMGFGQRIIFMMASRK
jgi:hypothetical protein